MNISGWFAITASALFSTSLGLIAFFAGLKRIDTANASIISTFEVVVTVTLAIIVLGETLSFPKIVGACLVILAVVVLAKSEYKTAQVKISHSISR
jgi:drug/metabolite transporter (DMT)-like permease